MEDARDLPDGSASPSAASLQSMCAIVWRKVTRGFESSLPFFHITLFSLVWTKLERVQFSLPFLRCEARLKPFELSLSFYHMTKLCIAQVLLCRSSWSRRMLATSLRQCFTGVSAEYVRGPCEERLHAVLNNPACPFSYYLFFPFVWTKLERVQLSLPFYNITVFFPVLWSETEPVRVQFDILSYEQSM